MKISRESSQASRRSYHLGMLILASVSLLACDGRQASPREPHRTTSFLTSFLWQSEGRVFTSGRPQPSWVSLAGEQTPAISSGSDFEVSVRVDHLERSRLEASYGLLHLSGASKSGRPQAPTGVTFRVRVQTSPEDPGMVLFEDTVCADMGSLPLVKPVVIELGDLDAAGERFITLEARFTGPNFARARAAWLNPVVQGLRAPVSVRATRPMNVLIVTADTTRRDFLSCYGGESGSRTIARLATEGVVFDNAFSVAFGTTPSHASLFTGSHAAAHGVYDNSTVLAAEQITLAEVLRDHGYATAAFVSAQPVVNSLGLSQGFDVYDDLFLTGGPSRLGSFARNQRRADLTASRFLAWLNRTDTEPFFAWLHFFDPHQPYSPPEEWVKTLPPRTDDLDSLFENANGEPRYVHAKELLQFSPDEMPAIAEVARERYRRELDFLDHELGRVFAALRAHDLDERTLIIFVADHGENFLEHQPVMAFTHASLLATVSHIPLIVKVPGSSAPIRRTEILVGNLDIAPTILEALGISAPSVWSGQSFYRGLTTGVEGDSRLSLVLEGAHEFEIGVRSRRWLYRQILPQRRGRRGVLAAHGYRSSPVEVFDLENDPNTRDPINPWECPDFSRLEAIAEGFLAQKTQIQKMTLENEAHLEALKALGYVR